MNTLPKKKSDTEIHQEYIFSDETPMSERESLMEGIADSFATEDHLKKFTDEEKQRFKNKLADVSIELVSHEKELADFRKEKQDEMKPLKEYRKELIDNLRTGAVMTTEKLYRIVDVNTNTIGVYDRFGILQRIEKLKRGKGLQTTIKPLKVDESEEIN